MQLMMKVAKGLNPTLIWICALTNLPISAQKKVRKS